MSSRNENKFRHHRTYPRPTFFNEEPVCAIQAMSEYKGLGGGYPFHNVPTKGGYEAFWDDPAKLRIPGQAYPKYRVIRDLAKMVYEKSPSSGAVRSNKEAMLMLKDLERERIARKKQGFWEFYHRLTMSRNSSSKKEQLECPPSRYANPKTTAIVHVSATGSLGIRIKKDEDTGHCTVVALVGNAKAAATGRSSSRHDLFQVGDRLLSVNGVRIPVAKSKDDAASASVLKEWNDLLRASTTINKQSMRAIRVYRSEEDSGGSEDEDDDSVVASSSSELEEESGSDEGSQQDNNEMPRYQSTPRQIMKADGTYRKPCGVAPKGYQWDAIKGKWRLIGYNSNSGSDSNGDEDSSSDAAAAAAADDDDGDDERKPLVRKNPPNVLGPRNARRVTKSTPHLPHHQQQCHGSLASVECGSDSNGDEDLSSDDGDEDLSSDDGDDGDGGDGDDERKPPARKNAPNVLGPRNARRVTKSTPHLPRHQQKCRGLLARVERGRKSDGVSSRRVITPSARRRGSAAAGVKSPASASKSTQSRNQRRKRHLDDNDDDDDDDDDHNHDQDDDDDDDDEFVADTWRKKKVADRRGRRKKNKRKRDDEERSAADEGGRHKKRKRDKKRRKKRKISADATQADIAAQQQQQVDATSALVGGLGVIACVVIGAIGSQFLANKHQ